MELLEIKPAQTNGIVKIAYPEDEPNTTSSENAFIIANTTSTTFEDIKNNHIIPVFIKDNEPLISHADFIKATIDVAKKIYPMETILQPSIRVSHPIKGRVPEAKNKAAIDLNENEKTLYYERMAFVIEIPSISAEIGGNTLSLSIGGVKSYSLDNFYGKQGSDEHFKVFVGFTNKVCLNLCVWSDGYTQLLKVKSLGQLQMFIKMMLEQYNASYHLENLRKLEAYSITETQFAQIIGRCRMYHNLPLEIKKDITPLLFGDNQIGAVCKDFYRDNSFCKDELGNINLWKLFNLFTGVNKSSYIDNFLEKSVNAFHFVEQIKWCQENKFQNWFLS